MTQFERFKAQMAVLVPLVRKLRAELGADKADALVADALDGASRAHGEALARRGVSVVALEKGLAAFAADDALEYDVVARDAERFDFNVRRCAYTEHLERIGARDLGPLLACRGDFANAEGMGIDLERTQTIMTGAPCCDFRYKLR